MIVSQEMKKTLSVVAALLMALQLQAQTTAPPLHEGEEEEPKDLALEPAPRKKPAQPQPTQPTAPSAEPTTPPQEPPPAEEKVQVAPEKPIELPSPKPPLPEPEPPKPEIKVPANIPVVPVEPTIPETPTTAMPASMPASADGGPMKDAGSDLTNALPVTYALYNDNSLSPADTVDTYKFYGRTKEGVGVIVVPRQPSSQLTCEIINEHGEFLSEAKALNPGETLSFQTSPLEQNSILYFKIRDLNLLSDSPPDEVRKYSLELKPIQSITITQPVQPIGEEKPVEEQKAEESKPKKETEVIEKPQEINWILYGLIGIGVLAMLIVGMIVLRKFRRPKEGQ